MTKKIDWDERAMQAIMEGVTRAQDLNLSPAFVAASVMSKLRQEGMRIVRDPSLQPLGDTQKKVLESLREHGVWYEGCGWRWDTWSNTARIMDRLVQRGLATKKVGRRATCYYPVGEGRNDK